jgi:Zn-dependent protease
MDLTASDLALGLLWYVVFLFSTTLHEAAHAWTALRLGDPTAYEGGQVSLNPWPHMRRALFGTVLVPWLAFAFTGWMIGWASAPYDPQWADRHPRRAAIMSLAGPASNLLLVVLSGLAIRGGIAAGVFAVPRSLSFSEMTVAVSPSWEVAATLLSVAFVLNLVLFAFNLIPVPPLDGSGALPLVLPEHMARSYQQALLEMPMLAFVGLIFAWRAFEYLFAPLWRLSAQILYPGFF